MKEYIHQENLALFKKRLAEPRTNSERDVLKKLLADELAKEPPPKMECSSHVDLHQKQSLLKCVVYGQRQNEPRGIEFTLRSNPTREKWHGKIEPIIPESVVGVVASLGP